MRPLDLVIEPEPGNANEAGGILNPAGARGPDGHLYLFPQARGEGKLLAHRHRAGAVRLEGRAERHRTTRHRPRARDALRTATGRRRVRRPPRHLRRTVEALRHDLHGVLARSDRASRWRSPRTCCTGIGSVSRPSSPTRESTSTAWTTRTPPCSRSPCPTLRIDRSWPSSTGPSSRARCPKTP